MDWCRFRTGRYTPIENSQECPSGNANIFWIARGWGRAIAFLGDTKKGGHTSTLSNCPDFQHGFNFHWTCLDCIIGVFLQGSFSLTGFSCGLLITVPFCAYECVKCVRASIRVCLAYIFTTYLFICLFIFVK